MTYTPTVVNLRFLDRSHYFLFQVAPHLRSRGSVDPVPGPLLLSKRDSAGNRTRELWGDRACSSKTSVGSLDGLRSIIALKMELVMIIAVKTSNLAVFFSIISHGGDYEECSLLGEKTRSYLTGITLSLRYRAQPVNAMK
jgi:hypothetical protein